jgi:hypothetical protein
MSMWISNQSVGLAVLTAAALRALQHRAQALASPATLRRARSGAVRLITVVAGH